MQRLAIFSAALSAVLLFAACSDDEDPKTSEGGSCKVDSDCKTGLLCRDTICVKQINNDVDMGNNGNDGGNNDQDMGNPIEDEEYLVSYIAQDAISDSRSLDLINVSSGEKWQISPEGFDCGLGCWATADLKKYVYLIRNVDTPGTFDVLVADIGPEYAGASTGTTMAVAVRSVDVVGNELTYVRAVSDENIAYYQEISSASGESTVGSIGTTTGTEGDWHLSTAAQKAVVYQPELQKMDLLIGDLGETLSEVTYTIDSSNYQSVSGSYFGGDVATAFSPDGKYMALLTSKAPLDYNTCASAGDCTGVGMRCGIKGRCAVIELAIHMIDMSNLDNLGERCGADDACGPVHRCDIPSELQLDKAVCIPRRVVLGLPGEQQQGDPAQRGCLLTDGLADLYYTNVRGPLSFGPDGSLFAVASRNCDDLNIPGSDILKLHPTKAGYEVMFGNDGKNFDDALCYDAAEAKVDIAECVVYTDRALVSPGGNNIAFTATNPNVVDPSRAVSTLDLWDIKRDGSDKSWPGNHGELTTVERFWVHPVP